MWVVIDNGSPVRFSRTYGQWTVGSSAQLFTSYPLACQVKRILRREYAGCANRAPSIESAVFKFWNERIDKVNVVRLELSGTALEHDRRYTRVK